MSSDGATAALHGPVVGLYRLAGHAGITEATCWAGRAIHRPFDLRA